MKKTVVILGILVVVTAGVLYWLSSFTKVSNEQVRADVYSFIQKNELGIAESEFSSYDLRVTEINDDMYEVVITFDGLHDDSVNSVTKTFILERAKEPEKFKLYRRSPDEYKCSRGETKEGICL